MKFLHTPFPRPKSNWKNISWLLLISLSSSLFILFFKPFDIQNETGDWFVYLILFSLGVVFFLAAAFMEFVVPALLPKLFARWNFGKAILWYTFVLLFVGGIIFLYKTYLGGYRDFTYIEYVMVLGRVLGIGITVSFFTLGIYTNLNRKRFSSLSTQEKYLITAPNAKTLALNVDEVLYIVSDDNYVDIHLRKDGVRKKLIFRSSLKNIEAQIVTPISPIYRCHRRYLINITQFEIRQITSRSSAIGLLNGEDEIPVSKQYVDTIAALLQVHP